MKRASITAAGLMVGTALLAFTLHRRVEPPRSGGRSTDADSLFAGAGDGCGGTEVGRGFVTAGTEDESGGNILRPPAAAGLFHMDGNRILFREVEIYHDVYQESKSPRRGPPSIEGIRPCENRGSARIVESGGLVEISGGNLGSATRITVQGKSTPPLAAGANYVVCRLVGLGPSRLQLDTPQGHAASPFDLILIKVNRIAELPRRLQVGQTADVKLGIAGTAEPVVLLLKIEGPAVSFSDGSREKRVPGSGGALNEVEARVEARVPGPFRITYCLSGEEIRK